MHVGENQSRQRQTHLHHSSTEKSSDEVNGRLDQCEVGTLAAQHLLTSTIDWLLKGMVDDNRTSRMGARAALLSTCLGLSSSFVNGRLLIAWKHSSNTAAVRSMVLCSVIGMYQLRLVAD